MIFAIADESAVDRPALAFEAIPPWALRQFPPSIRVRPPINSSASRRRLFFENLTRRLDAKRKRSAHGCHGAQRWLCTPASLRETFRTNALFGVAHKREQNSCHFCRARPAICSGFPVQFTAG